MPDINTNGQDNPPAPNQDASQQPVTAAQPSQDAKTKQDTGGRRRPVSVPPDQVNNRPAAQPDKKNAVRPPGAPKRAEEMDFSRIMRTVLLWAVLLLGVIFLVVVFNRNNGP